MPFHRNTINYIPPGRLVQFADSDRLYKVAECRAHVFMGIPQWQLELINPTEDEVIVFEIMES